MAKTKLQADFILKCLQSDPRWWFGLELVEASDGLLRRGTVYITLARLEEDGIIVGRKAECPSCQIPRRMYRLKNTL